jgi:ATP-dependent helicase HrpA
MTDGILLAQTQNDPLLLAYDTLIIDEAHERSLNIDFLLGYLKQILPKRPDLKVIITSATIDATSFAKHFANVSGEVPIIEVSGRLYPVEVRYRPIDLTLSTKERDGKESKELSEAIKDAVFELWQSGVHGMGDILVFFPGEREIRDCEQVLRKDISLIQKFQPEILSLFARQSVAEQERVFNKSAGRRIILSTNVAETSLTVPGIRFVIDTGLARVKRYSYRNKVEQLQIEPISQAAAKQRAGRCGRVSDGVCIRLYSEEDFLARSPQTDPEILRSSLAAVILRMAALKLSRIQDFPFLQAPLGRAISDGVQLLEELGAVETLENSVGKIVELTTIGKELAKLPLDPRVSRMLIAAKENHALREVLIIASAMAIQDPRDRPLEQAQNADRAHQIFADGQSEFLSYVKIMQWYQEALNQKLSNRALDNLCKKQFISPRRMREWLDVYRQLQNLLHEQGWRENQTDATYEQIHASLLTGLLGNIAKKSDLDKVYDGARGIKLFIWPGSTLSKKAGNWLVAAELIETNRLYARTIAKIDPRWIEKISQHRLVKSWSEPFWDQRSGEIMAHEQGALYGLTIYNGRKVRFSLKQADQARELFIQRALVEGGLFGSMEVSQIQKQYGKVFRFYWVNQQLIKQVEALEHRSRRQDVLVDDLLIYDFYQKHLPTSVFSRSSLQAWLDKDKTHGDLLVLKKN